MPHCEFSLCNNLPNYYTFEEAEKDVEVRALDFRIVMIILFCAFSMTKDVYFFSTNSDLYLRAY